MLVFVCDAQLGVPGPTLTAAEYEWLPAEAVICAQPLEIALTNPVEESTVATEVLLDFQVGVAEMILLLVS